MASPDREGAVPRLHLDDYERALLEAGKLVVLVRCAVHGPLTPNVTVACPAPNVGRGPAVVFFDPICVISYAHRDLPTNLEVDDAPVGG